ncbi:MAG: hypothetical protein AB1847_14230 [bacterium]
MSAHDFSIAESFLNCMDKIICGGCRLFYEIENATIRIFTGTFMDMAFNVPSDR